MAWFHACPGPTKIVMIFSFRNPTAKVRVTVLDSAGCTFLQGATQTITGSGTITWTVQKGFTLSPPQDARGQKFLPPRQVVKEAVFEFTPLGDFTVLDLLDWEEFLWTYAIVYDEVC